MGAVPCTKHTGSRIRLCHQPNWSFPGVPPSFSHLLQSSSVTVCLTVVQGGAEIGRTFILLLSNFSPRLAPRPVRNICPTRTAGAGLCCGCLRRGLGRFPELEHYFPSWSCLNLRGLGRSCRSTSVCVLLTESCPVDVSFVFAASLERALPLGPT